MLPTKINNKLVFTLCYTCAIQSNQERCTHNEQERALSFTWCTPEIHLALEKGYKIIKLYEVYHYDETSQYDEATKTGGLFTGYINANLKAKQESSGYPASVVTEQEKDKYISDYYQHEGVMLDKTKIKKNPGQRTLAKLQLNTLWVAQS